MKNFKQTILVAAVLSLTVTPALAASGNASQAGKHSALAVSHGTVASTKVASGLVATPLVVVGAAGELSGKAGENLMDYALEFEPLEISDDVVIADPAPGQVIRHEQRGGI